MKVRNSDTETTAEGITQMSGNKNIVVRKDVSHIRLRPLESISSSRFLKKSLSFFSAHDIPIYLMTSSNTNISMVVKTDTETFRLLRDELSGIAGIAIESHVAGIGISGEAGEEDYNTGNRIIELLHDIPILMISYESGNNCIWVAIRECDYSRAIRILSEHFSGTGG